jgi:8-hydroxy-5-deazaflavin:NADPH oxidoreductase
MASKIAIIGDGNVGQALAQGLRRSGHEIVFGTTDPKQPVKDAAAASDIVILAVPWKAQRDIVKSEGRAFDGKTVVDVSNAISPTMELAVGLTTSAAEELQKALPKAKVVKAFNTIFAGNMATGHSEGEALTALVAGDDPASKKSVMDLAREIGFDVVDAGPLKSARYLEPLGMLNISLGYGMKMGTNIGFKLVKGKNK